VGIALQSDTDDSGIRNQPVARFVRETTHARIHEGTRQIQRLVIARRLAAGSASDRHEAT